MTTTWAATWLWHVCGGIGGFAVGLLLGLRQIDEAIREAYRLQQISIDAFERERRVFARADTTSDTPHCEEPHADLPRR